VPSGLNFENDKYPNVSEGSSIADPHHFDADPDPAFEFDADPDPDFFPRVGPSNARKWPSKASTFSL
jgi:hypothetical protein